MRIIEFKMLICSIVLAFLCLMNNAVFARSVEKNEINSAFDEWLEELEDLKKEDLNIDSTAYSTDFMTSFIEGVFSETPWNQQLAPDVQRILLRFFLARLNSEPRNGFRDYDVMSWLGDYATKVNGFPVFGALNKWEKKTIKVSVGWPIHPPKQKMPPGYDGLYLEAEITGIKKSYDIIVDQIKKIAPEIHAATGISLEMNSLSGEEDFTKGFGRLRFVDGGTITEGKYSKSLSAKSIKDISYLLHGDIHTFEPLFYGGVSYTNGVDDQIEGYFLPNDKNLIQLAVCKIHPGLKEDVLRAYITECVARSLGVPDVIFSVSDSIFGLWAKEGRYPQNISPFDKKILSALYCDEAAPSMQRYEVSKILISSKKCQER